MPFFSHRMPWTVDPSVMIDRFDARANLETYSTVKNSDIKLVLFFIFAAAYYCLSQIDLRFLGLQPRRKSRSAYATTNATDALHTTTSLEVLTCIFCTFKVPNSL